MAREHYLSAAVGTQGTGKTYRTKENIKKLLAQQRRVLILDRNSEYVGIKTIAPEHVGWFSVHPRIEARRILLFDPKTGAPLSIDEAQNILGQVLLNVRNCYFIIEDLNTIVADTVRQDFIGQLVNIRHRNVDVLTSYQGIGRIVPKIWQNLSVLRMHFITESVMKHKTKYEDKVDYMSIAQKIVEHHYYNLGDKYFFVNIDLRKRKIFGKYTEEEFDAAAKEYIYENSSALVAPLLKQIDWETKEKKYNEVSAMEVILQRFTNQFSQYSR